MIDKPTTDDFDLTSFKAYFEQLFASVQSLHTRLDAFEQLNSQLKQDNASLLSAFTNMQQRLAALEAAHAPVTNSPPPAPKVQQQQIPVQPAQPSLRPTSSNLPPAKPSNKWNQMLKRPARNVSSILIHVDYQKDVLRFLAAGGVHQVPKFDPADPNFACMDDSQFDRIATALHTDCCIRIIRFIKSHNVHSVLKYFVSKNWISPAMAQSLSSELLPRPAKRLIDPKSNIGQLLMQPLFEDKLVQRVTVMNHVCSSS